MFLLFFFGFFFLSFFLFFCFFFLFVFFFFLFCLCFFVGGFKGQVRWPKGPPHLALNPPYFFFCFCFLFFVLLFFGGFKGQVRWPKGPPHLALNPPYLFFVVFVVLFFFGFVFWLFNTEKNLVFPPEKGIFCLFSVFLFLSPLALLGLPLFLFLFLCLSFFFFSFFLPSCLCFCFLLVPCFCSFFVSFSFFFAFLSWKEQHQNIKLQVFFFLKSFLFFSFLPFFLSSSFFLSLLFPDFKLCFLFNIKVFGFKTKNLEKNIFWSKGGLQQNGFFLSTCVLQNVKSYRFFFGHFFLAIFGWCSKNTIKIGISAHF